MATPISPVPFRWHRFRLAETDAAFISADVAQLIVSSISRVSPRGACVSSPVSTSVLADKPELHRQWRLVLLVSYSLDQRLIGQPLASHAVHETVKPRQGMVLHVALIQPERKFINVATKMLFARVMVNAVNAAFHDRENTLNAIRGHVVADVFTSAVIDGCVLERFVSDLTVDKRLVCVEHGADFDILDDCLPDSFLIHIGDRHSDRPAAALAHAKNRRLADRAATGLELLRLVLIGFLAADESFVNFDDTGKLLEIATAASFPEPVQNEPSRLLRDPDLFRQLHAGYALAGRHEQVHRVNPLVQGNVAALEDCAGTHREVLCTLVAAVEAAAPFRDPLPEAANRATRAIRPQSPFQVRPGCLLVREQGEKLEGRNGALGHGLYLDFWPDSSPKNRGSQVYNSHFKLPWRGKSSAEGRRMG